MHFNRSLSMFASSLALTLFACSEAQTDDGSGGAGGDASGGASSAETSASSTSATATSGSDTSSSATGSTTATTTSGGGNGSVVINEIDPDLDWIELHNVGDAAFDLSGLTLADEETPGTPKLAEAILFPAGTSLAAGAYVFVLAKQDAVVMPGEQAPQTMCDPGPSPCFYAPFGLSGSNGDGVYVLDGDTVVTSASFGPAAVPAGSTWCRDDAGNYATCATPTPGAAN
jgi:hypothetical protein